MENKGISKYIRSKLDGITSGKALPMKVLVQDVLETFNHVKDTTNASVRVNSVLNQAKVKEKYTRMRGPDKLVYIVLKSDVPQPPEAPESEKGGTYEA